MSSKPIRRSKQRDKILEYLRRTDAHPTAQTIYHEVLPEFPSLSLGTVYRNLNILEERGLVRRLQFGSTFDRYDADTLSHSHFYCRICGQIYDLPLKGDTDLRRHIAEENGHKIDEYRIDFYGICEQCLVNEAENR